MSNYDYWSEDLNATEDILEHHGILGQKWGVRRYQNEDGSLTEEGRRHYGITKYAHNDGYRVNKRLNQFEDAAEKYNNAQVKYLNNKNAETARARQQARDNYEHVKSLMKKAKQADEGEKLYEQGKTISSRAGTVERISGGVGAAGIIAGSAAATLANAGIDKIALGTDVNKINIDTWSLAGMGVLLGTASGALNMGLNAIRVGQDNKLRAYYDYRIREK